MSARRRRSAHPPMTAVAMPLDKLDLWLQGRTGAAATNLAMLDGFVSAVVAGPVSMDPPEWICPLLGIEVDAFNHGGTPEFAAISAVAVRHNVIVETLSKAPKTFEPIFARKPNRDIDAGPWCDGFYAAMKLRLSAWAPLSNPADINHGLLLPILFHCVDDQGRPMLGPKKQGQTLTRSGEQPTSIFRPSSKTCVSTGCRHASRPDRSYRADVEAHTAYA